MNQFYRGAILCCLMLFAGGAFAQQVMVTDAKRRALNNISFTADTAYKRNHQKAISQATSRGWAIYRRTKNGGVFSLQGVNSLGFPKFLVTHNNTTAAATTGTNQVQPGGALGLNLSGSSAFLVNKLAIWDGGWVYGAHQEFTGKTIALKDTSTVADHATHVAGTMLARGAYAPAKGMAFGATSLLSYDFNNDVTEMSRAAPGLLLSNHSYGDVGGWNYNDAASRWEWYGLPGDTVDYNFGFYDSRAQAFDKIAYNAPYYLIVESSGNARGYPGPAVGSTYYGYASRTNQTIVNKGPRPATISSNTGYDNITTTGNAKNILTVGAVNPLPNGPSSSADITMPVFSSWGPTDDGRVKPDVVGDGVNVLSSASTSTTAYSAEDGTSFSAPNVTGSLYLLQEYYAQKNSGSFMRSATLKALACHTAIDAGNIGPDYVYGWGLLSMPKAAQAITDNGNKSLIRENTLTQGQTQTFTAVASGSGPLMATIAWTDLQGTPTADGVINNRTPKLVNDLDIRISDGTNTYTPWVLDPANPGTAATKGDNVRDNVEQVYLANAITGRTYTITVTHKGTLQSGSQAYSLIVTGIGGNAYCASAPTSTADSRVDNFSLSNINFTNPAGCTSYTDNTALTAQLEQGKTYPLNLTLGTCGNNFNKAAKVYIDWNGNGIFDANELVATTNIINNTSTYTTNITIPLTVVPNNYSLMRVVLNETADPNTIQPCGAYAKGETQDYRVQFLQTATDAGITAIINPAASGTCNGTTAVTVKIKNFGRAAITNIPVTVTITAANGTVTTISETYIASLAPLQEDNFTLSNTFNAAAGSTYTITAATALAGDPVSTNNQASQSVLIFTPGAPGNLSALYCINTSKYQLTGAGDGTLLWYQNINDALPIAYGSNTSTTTAPVNGTYYTGLNDFSGTVGPATKNVFTGGGYNQFSPAIKVYTAIPMIIQSARLYIGNAGVITFNVTNANGQIVVTTTINAAATRSNPAPGALADDPTDPGRIYNLNLLLPAAGNYTISAVYDANVTLYRNNTGVTGYPFKAGTLFSITGNDAVPTTGTDTTYYKSYYYYLYNVQIKSAGCASVARLPVTLSKPVITQTAFTLSSSFTTGNQWYLDGKLITAATGQTYDPLQSGNYRVTSTLSTGCVVQSDAYFYARVALHPGTNTEIGLVSFPVPADKQLNIVFVAKATSELTLSLINGKGQTVYSKTQTAAAGNFSTVINVTNLPVGTYVLKVVLGSDTYAQKVIIIR